MFHLKSQATGISPLGLEILPIFGIRHSLCCGIPIKNRHKGTYKMLNIKILFINTA